MGLPIANSFARKLVLEPGEALVPGTPARGRAGRCQPVELPRQESHRR